MLIAVGSRKPAKTAHACAPARNRNEDGCSRRSCAASNACASASALFRTAVSHQCAAHIMRLLQRQPCDMPRLRCRARSIDRQPCQPEPPQPGRLAHVHILHPCPCQIGFAPPPNTLPQHDKIRTDYQRKPPAPSLRPQRVRCPADAEKGCGCAYREYGKAAETQYGCKMPPQ